MLAVKIKNSWTEEHLARAAKQQGKSRTALIREVVDNYLEDLETYEECDRRMADPRPSIPLEEVLKRCGLES